MEDNQETVEQVDIEFVYYTIHKMDRGHYVVFSVSASDEQDPVGHFEIKKSDTNFDMKEKLYRNAIMYINNVLRPT